MVTQGSLYNRSASKKKQILKIYNGGSEQSVNYHIQSKDYYPVITDSQMFAGGPQPTSEGQADSQILTSSIAHLEEPHILAQSREGNLRPEPVHEVQENDYVEAK